MITVLKKSRFCWIPSDKQPHNYGTSPCLMGKSTISMAIFNSYMLVYQRINLAELQ